jgi:hypothetical protein
MNSDASLDLAKIAQGFEPPLRSAISISLTDQQRLIGVLTGYSLQQEAFNENHRDIFEHVCVNLAGRLCVLQSNKSSHLLSFPQQKI